MFLKHNQTLGRAEGNLMEEGAEPEGSRTPTREPAALTNEGLQGLAETEPPTGVHAWDRPRSPTGV